MYPENAADKITPANVFDYALKIALDLQKEYPQSAAPYFLVGHVYYRASRYDQAIESFQKGLTINPNQAYIVQMVAFLYTQLNKYEKAVEWYRKTLVLKPDAQNVNARLGLILVQLKRMEEARAAFEQELHYYPDNAFNRIYLGERYFDDGRLREAREQAKTAAQLNPDLPGPYYLLSKINRKEGNTEAANQMLEIFQKKKKKEQETINPSNSSMTDQERSLLTASFTHDEAGVIYYDHGNKTPAETHFRKAISLNPKDEQSRIHLAQLYQESNQSEKTVPLYRELIVINPKEFQYHFLLGNVLAELKKFTEARESFEKALELSPDSVEAKRSLARVVLSGNGDPRKAVEWMESVVSAEPTAENYDLLSRSYYSINEVEKSLDALHKAIELDPQNPIYRQRYEKILTLRKSN